ncbi:GGDEF domain-containing protein [Acidovorax sp. SRB_14]|uniref:GGDEF domain-containing protein n=1 Tax=unclassified Acidovorax TaxID=2684926 RepID=UPI00145EB280|nr:MULTISPECIES: GGDEF domain-containing protein [unclassified Acidovorax]NMM76422.1 GGDEF domain-containing protein [Acidovorax sp. SRB_24]NMM79608.1 GGDEF domain-containing protein [Acidovorax sp. SRB_14]NMM89053.1 GGDEF domain-containing protein [Rhodococcus sp. SRB_17]
MVATILVGMLCAHLLCFSVMFWLISRRLHGKKMGMDFFAMGNLLLGFAYVLQLAEGGPAWSLMSVVNHTFTLASPVAYGLGAMRFFGHSVPLWRPLLAFAVTYGAAQVLVQWSLGPAARYAMLSGMSALLFLVMAITVVYGVRTFAKDLYGEMVFFAALISGICVLNALKFMKILDGGLDALQMDRNFQMVFYIYMSSLATVLPPSIVWLVLRRLTDDLRNLAARDPMTQLLNRRGLTEALQRYFNSSKAVPAHLLMVDVDHFKRINDTYGHQIGDAVLCHVAEVLRTTVRLGDLAGRIGGEEFLVICLDTDILGVMHLAERLRAAIENQAIKIPGSNYPLHCTITIGVSHNFAGAHVLEDAMQEADAALYRGKAAGRNRIELAQVAHGNQLTQGMGTSTTYQTDTVV